MHSRTPCLERSGAYRVLHTEMEPLTSIVAFLQQIAQGLQDFPERDSSHLRELQAIAQALPSMVSKVMLPSCESVMLSTGLVREGELFCRQTLASVKEVSARWAKRLDALSILNVSSRQQLSDELDDYSSFVASLLRTLTLLQRATAQGAVVLTLHDLFSDLANHHDEGVRVELQVMGDLEQSVVIQADVAIALMQHALCKMTRFTPCSQLQVRCLAEETLMMLSSERLQGKLPVFRESKGPTQMTLALSPRMPSRGHATSFFVSLHRHMHLDEHALLLMASASAAVCIEREEEFKLSFAVA